MKFPPGLGLLGASSGMIEMMVGLNSSGMDGIGNAMAVALVATFWGIAIANFVFLPLADYAARVASEDFFTRSLVVHGISLIKQGMAPKIIAETLISQLAIRDQVYLRNIFFSRRLWVQDSRVIHNSATIIIVCKIEHRCA